MAVTPRPSITLREILHEIDGLSERDAKRVIDRLIAGIADALADGKDVRITHLATLRVGQQGSRMARNPRTGEPAEVPGGKRLTIRTATAFKDRLNRRRML